MTTVRSGIPRSLPERDVTTVLRQEVRETYEATDAELVSVVAELDTKQDADSTLAALAALTLAADRLPYATGASTVAATDLTAAARALLAQTTYAAMRTLLGVSVSGGGASGAVSAAEGLAMLLAIAELRGGSQFQTPRSWVDDFSDADGIDAAGSSNEVYDAASDWFASLYAAVTYAPDANQVPAMTTNTAPSGTASASMNNDVAFRAFDNVEGTGTTINSFPGWVAYQFPTATQIGAYSVRRPVGDTVFFPASFKLQGSTDGSVWVDLDSRSGVSWTGVSVLEFTLAAPVTYARYRLYLAGPDGAAGSTVIVSALELISTDVVATPETFYAMDLRSQPVARLTQPARAYLFAIVRKGEATAPAPGTELRAFVSRVASPAGEGDWAEATLAATGLSAGGFTLFDSVGAVDLSGLAAGTTERLRLLTAANARYYATAWGMTTEGAA